MPSTESDESKVEKKLNELSVKDDTPNNEAEVKAISAAAEKKRAKNKKKREQKKKRQHEKMMGSCGGGPGSSGQSNPPRKPISELYLNNCYPEGQICEYIDDNNYRTTDEEKRTLDHLKEEQINDLRQAAEAHREVRKYAREHIKPGMGMTEIASMIEDGTRALLPGKDLKEAGIGFPTGLSLNHCAAHYTPNAGDKIVLSADDVLKVDIGTHVRGNIIDSAFTLAFDVKYQPLLDAVKEATNTGIREAGIDARLGEIGSAIQEVMESHEIVLNGKTRQIRSIRNLCGHNIGPYIIHSGKSVPIVTSNESTKMEEGELFAIETFGSTGTGYVQEMGVTSHYSFNKGTGATPKLASARKLMNTISKNFGTLPFCRRYLDRLGESRYLLALKDLINEGTINEYPPLCDTEGCYTAQFEHTLILRPTVKEVLSRGDDY